MNQIGLQNKPVGILNVDGYFDGWLAQMRRAVADGFLAKAELDRVQVSDDIETLLARMDAAARG